jgi:nitroreductase/ketosteroid isomerase-like protein
MGTREQQLKVVDDFFDGPRELDRLSLMSDDVEWWNGLGKFPGAPGQTVFRGKDEIGAKVLGRAPAPPQPNGRRVDRYDLATLSFDDVRTIVDGNHVFRQHTYRATTMRGRPYENVYGFLFRFTDDGLIGRIWEHWGTLQAWETLFQGPLVVTDPDLLLQTTPSVRKRLDLDRPVEREVIEECMGIAVHAPNGSNQQPYRFLFVDDPVKKQGLADIYRAALSDFVNRPRTDAPEDNIDRSDAASTRMTESVMHLAEHIHEVPVLCVPIVAGRTDGNGPGAQAERTDAFWQASRWGSVVPALWSLMLALRSRGLGSAWTTLTLVREREVAELLGFEYEKWMQAGLFPIAYTKGTEFQITPRRPAAEVMAWNGYATEA